MSDLEDGTRQLPTLQAVQHSKSHSRITSVPGDHSPDATVNTPLLDSQGMIRCKPDALTKLDAAWLYSCLKLHWLPLSATSALGHPKHSMGWL